MKLEELDFEPPAGELTENEKANFEHGACVLYDAHNDAGRDARGRH